jgi:hypothetical protein
MRHDLAGPLCQWAETAAAEGGCGVVARATGDQGRAVAGDLWGLQCAGGGVGGGGDGE